MSEPQSGEYANEVPIGERHDAGKQKVVLRGRLPTPIETALLEYGKQVTLSSVEVSVDFHKTMLQVSATFGTLITTLTPILISGDRNASLPMPEGWLLIAPPILMLSSSIAFALGYYPRFVALNANVVEEIEKTRMKAITSRRQLAAVGLLFFTSGLILTVVLALLLRLR